MSTTREPLLINPEAIPAQTAYDLAVLIYQLSPHQLREIISAAKQKYNEPMESWLWFLPYYVFDFRRRSEDFILSEVLTEERANDSGDLTESKAFAPISFMLGKENATWKEGSANTLLMREFLMHLKGYDHSIQISPVKLRELAVLLTKCIELRITLNHQLDDVESKLAEVCTRIADVERAIKFDRNRIETIRQSDFELEQRKEWIRKVNDNISQQQKQLIPMKSEEMTLSLERASIIKELAELNPAFNNARAMLETEEMYVEAAKIGKAAADAAKREYLTRLEEQRARNQDLARLKKVAPKLTERKLVESSAPTIDMRASRVQDAKEACLKSSVINNDHFKSKLTDLMQSISGHKPVLPKQAVVVEQSESMRKKQSVLERSGLFGAPRDTLAESSCSHQPRK